MSDIFNPTGAVSAPSKKSDLYKPNFKEGKGGIYKSIVRFIPYYEDTSKSIVEKYVCWVKNPCTQYGMYIDDPRSVQGKSSLSDTFFKLKNTGIANFEEIAKQCLSSKRQYASLVQIISDENHPELVGQIKVFVYGKQVWDKLHNEEFPQYNPEAGINPFHPIYGRHFQIVCTNKSNFNNFEQSMFFDDKNPDGTVNPPGMWYVNPKTKNMESAVNGVSGEVLRNYLAECSPRLLDYGFKEWTEEQTKHVTDVLTILDNYMKTGTLQNPNQATYTQASGVINGVGVSTPTQPIFPGSVPSQTAQRPVFPGAVVENVQNTVHSAPANIPQGFAPVTPPDLSPRSMSQDVSTTNPYGGINMDDVLKDI